RDDVDCVDALVLLHHVEDLLHAILRVVEQHDARVGVVDAVDQLLEVGDVRIDEYDLLPSRLAYLRDGAVGRHVGDIGAGEQRKTVRHRATRVARAKGSVVHQDLRVCGDMAADRGKALRAQPLHRVHVEGAAAEQQLIGTALRDDVDLAYV